MMSVRARGRGGRLTVAALAVWAVVAGGTNGLAQTGTASDYRLDGDFLSGFGRDFAAVVTSPLHWDGGDALRFSLVAGGCLGLVAADGRIMNWVQNHRTDFAGDMSAVFEKVGNGAYLLGFSAALYAAGEIGHSVGLRKTALLGLESLATASVIVWATKVIVGRARPYTGYGYHRFRMFSLDPDFNSFPSGHTAVAFAVAATVAQQTRSWPVDLLAYAAASLVGYARIHDNKHWASSAVAGAALGHFVARKIGRRHRAPEPAKGADLRFVLGSDRVAFTWNLAF